METGKAYSSRKMAINKIHNTRGEANRNRKRKVINNGSNNAKRLDKERKSVVRIERKGDEDKCCQVVPLKKQDGHNVRSVDGSEKVIVDGSKKDISHVQTQEIAGCERKPSETCVVKQKSNNSSNDALPLDKRTGAASHVQTDEIAGCERKPSETCVVKQKSDNSSNDALPSDKRTEAASHGQTDEIAGCGRKPSETCVAKQKSDNSSNDALPSDKRTEAASHGQTDEIAGCERKPSETCVAKHKPGNGSNDALPSDKRTKAATVTEKIAKHTTIVKTRVDGRERAMYQCGYCNKWKTSAALASNMLAHLQKHETGVLRCARCGHDAVSVPALEEHVARVHTRETRFVCALCGKACFSRKQLRQHEDIHNLHPRKCRHCGQTMRSLAQLKKHTKTEHHGDGLYSCDECRKTFVFKTWFEAHKARRACGLKATCSLCGAVVVKGGGMSAHMRRVHAGEKREVCSHCPFTAFTKTQVRLHERTHTRDHPFKCHLCPFSAAKKYQLTSHMRTHTGEKPFHCDQCPFASSWKVQLRAHQAAHTSTSAMTCDACAVVCKDASSLGVHKHREHGRSAGNRKPTKPTTRCEMRKAVASVTDVTSAGSCRPDTEVTVEEAATGSDEVTSYIIVNEAVAKDIERMGLETVALVLLDNTTGGETITTQKPSSGEATQHIEDPHITNDVTGDKAEVTKKEHPSLDTAAEGCERKHYSTASETVEHSTLKLTDVKTTSRTSNRQSVNATPPTKDALDTVARQPKSTD